MAMIVRSTGVAFESGMVMSSSRPKGSSSRRAWRACSRQLHPAEATPVEPAVESEVVHGVQLEHEPEVLVDEAEPGRVAGPAVAEGGDVDRLTVEPRLGPGSGLW